MMKQKKGSSTLEKVEKDDVLQAVVIADNFNNNFLPILSESPLSLMPLVCMPLINYTLESLAQSGVQETFLFCCQHADQIRSHIQQSMKEKIAWRITMTVHIVVSESCRSLSDALRDLDAKGHIRGYFILTGVDTISNVQLMPLLEKHKEISKKDKGAAMTLLYKKASPGHRAQISGDNVLLAVNATTNRILFHQKYSINDQQQKASFPLEIFLDNPNVEIHTDLIDTHLSICSPSVLPLFSDNFDFQTRDDFIKGILMNEEILASTLYMHVLKGDEYASRVTNWQMYQTVSQDVIHRWVYPLVPDMKISSRSQKYTILRNHVYRSRDATLAKGCELEEDVVIAKDTEVDEGTHIIRSVVDEQCRIGKDCKIIDSVIMSGCDIRDGCSISTSLVGEGCVINDYSIISGSVLGPRVQVDSKTEVKTQLVQSTAGESSEKLGEHAYTLPSDDCDNESVDSETSINRRERTMSTGLVSQWWDDKESIGYVTSEDEGSSDAMSPAPDDVNLFLQEVIDSLARGYEEKLNCDCLILEINSSRYAYNVSLQEVNFYVIRALFSLPAIQSTKSNPMESFKYLVNSFKAIITNYIKGMDAMIDCLRAVEESCTQENDLEKIIAKIIHHLYEVNIVSEDAILKWFSDTKKDNSPLSRQTGLVKLIEWLNEASEESDDEEEDSS